MKIFPVLILALAALGWTLTSCDKLDPPYATVVTKYDTTGKPYVLLEEYTGVRCINCPTATQEAHELAKYYIDRVILMAVHATELADTNKSYPLYLKTPEGNQWNSDYTVGYVPRGLVNRAKYNSAFPINKDKWASAIDVQLAKPVVCVLKGSATYNSASKQITANLSAYFKSTLPAGAKVCLYITEDGIQGKQANNDPNVGTTPDIDPYTFDNTFRGSMNSTYGEQLTASIEVNKIYTYSKTFTVTNQAWNTGNLYIIALVTNASPDALNEVVTVTRFKVTAQ